MWLLLRRTPLPTLFPYTPLFRSTTPAEVSPSVGGRHRHAVQVPRRRAGWSGAAGSGHCVRGGEERLHRLNDVSQLRLGDRKSTRLNSSHLVISYAVFCLKKKNNI